MIAEQAMSDLAIESNGIKTSETSLFGNKVTVGESNGGISYTLHTCTDIHLTARQKQSATLAIAELLLRLIKHENVGTNAPVTVICLGNRSLTCDSLGPFCAKKIIATRAFKSINKPLFDSFCKREISVITPGVTIETGIDALELARACRDFLKSELIIVPDSLRARSTDRLFSVIQLSSSGIIPGSGVGNHQSELSKQTLGIPVISIGVPTVVSAQTLVYDVLKDARAELDNIELSDTLEKRRSFFVTPRDADLSVKAYADIISAAINRAFLGITEI